MRRLAICFAACWALLSSAETVAQTRSPERKPRVYALLIDWTGYFIGDAAQTRRVCEAATEHATGLLFPAGGAPSPLGFDPAFDRLFVARFGLLTNRYGVREPLRDFLQVQLGLDSTGPFDAGDLRAAIRAPPGLRNRDGTRGAQYGFPSIIWTLAVDRINRQAESAGLEIESVYLLILSDDKPNPADEGIQVGEKIPCLDLLRKHNSGDAQRFNEFFRVYSNHLEVIERDPGIPPIRRIGEDGTGYFSAYEIRPKPASLNLADALRIEPEDYSVRSDGTYAGTVAVTPKFADIAPAEVVSLGVELWDRGTAVFDPTPISPDLGEQELWTELPGHLGELSGADRQYAIRAAVTIRFPAEDADGQYLSQFVTTLTYVTPVPVVRLVGLLADSEGRLIDPSRLKPGETQDQAKRRIDGGLSLKQVVFWSIVAVIAAAILAGILYLIFYWAPARLEVAPGQPREVVIDLRTAERSDQAAHLGSVRIENFRSKRGRFAEWTGELRIDEVAAHPGLRTAAGVSKLEELVTFHKKRPRRQSGQVTDRQYRVLDLYLLQGLIEDLAAPGLPDDQGRFAVELRITVSLITSTKVGTRSCVLSVPIQVLAPRVRWSAEWRADEEEAEPRFLYSDIVSQPQIIQRLRVFHDHEQQALWPQPVRLVLRGPQREPNPSLRFGACVQGEDLGTARSGEFGPEVSIERFGLHPALEFPVYQTAFGLDEPSHRDHKVTLQLYQVETDLLIPYGRPATVRIALAEYPPYPTVQLTGWGAGRKSTLIAFPHEDEPDDEVFVLNQQHPKSGNRKVKDPWGAMILELELGNQAEKSAPGRRRSDSGKYQPGTVSFKVQPLLFAGELPELGLDQDDWAQRFRLIELAERRTAHGDRITDYLHPSCEFAHQEPSSRPPRRFRLELNEYAFSRLRKEYSELDFDLRIDAYLDGHLVKTLSRSFRLPMISDYGTRWLLIDIGTSAITAMDFYSQSGEYQLLELQEARASSANAPGEGTDHDTRIETDSRLLPSTLFLEPTDKPGDYTVLFSAEPDYHAASAHSLPPLKLLVGSNRIHLDADVLRTLGIKKDELPAVDEVLQKALTGMLDSFIKPCMPDGKIPAQLLLSIPNTFTPAHCALLRTVAQEDLGVERVIFLSESDAVCWYYLALEEENRKRQRDVAETEENEYVLIADIGAGTSDLTYVLIRRSHDGDLDKATVIHRDGFRYAGNNVDTCLGRMFHHKMAALCGLPGSPYIYSTERRVFPTDGEKQQQSTLMRRDRFFLVNALRRMKIELSGSDPAGLLKLHVPTTTGMFLKRQTEDETRRELVEGAIRLRIDQATKDEFRFSVDEILNAPAYRTLVVEDMAQSIIRHFFEGCPDAFPDCPGDWRPDKDHFPVDTFIVTGRASLTPGLKVALIRFLEQYRPADSPELAVPEICDAVQKPEDLKLAVLNGARSYLDMFGSAAAYHSEAELDDSGLYEDYYLYTGRGTSFARCYPLLTRERDRESMERLPAIPGAPPLLRFHGNITVPFKDADGKVIILATSSRRPPADPFEPGAHSRLLCLFSQENRNREVNIRFTVDSNRDYSLEVDDVDLSGREHRYETQLLERMPGIRENLWPNRPCDAGVPEEHFTLHLPRLETSEVGAEDGLSGSSMAGDGLVRSRFDERSAEVEDHDLPAAFSINDEAPPETLEPHPVEATDSPDSSRRDIASSYIADDVPAYLDEDD